MEGKNNMKLKTLILGIALMGTVGTQAAEMNWTAASIRDPAGVATITAGQLDVALIFTADVGSTTGYQTSFGTYTYGNLSSLNVVKESGSGGVVVSSGAGKIQALVPGDTGYAVWDQTTCANNRGADGLASFYMVVFYNAAGSASEGNCTSYGITKVYNVDLSNIENLGSAASFLSTYNNIQWTAVPEPGTMTLAFVGAGVLALRRRFSKKEKKS